MENQDLPPVIVPAHLQRERCFACHFLNKLYVKWACLVVIPPFLLLGAPVRNQPRPRRNI